MYSPAPPWGGFSTVLFFQRGQNQIHLREKVLGNARKLSITSIHKLSRQILNGTDQILHFSCWIMNSMLLYTICFPIQYSNKTPYILLAKIFISTWRITINPLKNSGIKKIEWYQIVIRLWMQHSKLRLLACIVRSFQTPIHHFGWKANWIKKFLIPPSSFSIFLFFTYILQTLSLSIFAKYLTIFFNIWCQESALGERMFAYIELGKYLR